MLTLDDNGVCVATNNAYDKLFMSGGRQST